jgi:hypothetical protein
LTSALAGARGVHGNFHFPVPSMNRLNQNEPATFSILLYWTFFRDSVLKKKLFNHWKTIVIGERFRAIMALLSSDTHQSACPVPKQFNLPCYLRCNSNDDCSGNSVCCRDGCSTVCQQPRTVYCKLEGQQYRVNDTYSPEPCTVCWHCTLF